MPEKISLITGASSGIGWELAWIFASKGHNLLLVARSGEKLQLLAKEIKEKYQVSVYVLSADLSKEKSVKEVFSYCQANKLEVDNLVNNAGFGDFNLFADSSLNRNLGMIKLNISALVELTHLFLPAMIKNKQGRILNIASAAAFQPGPLMSVYYASKAFVLHFGEAIANELDKTGVTCTTICPGPTKSNFKATANLKNSRLMKKRNLPSAKSVAEFSYQSMIKAKVVAIPGLKYNFLAALVRFLPRKTVTKLVRKAQEVF